MDRGLVIIRKMMFLTISLVCCLVTFNNLGDIEFNSDATMYIIDEYTDTYYEPLSDNIGLTNINGISNVYVNMKSMGYNIYKEEIKNNSIDVSFVKDGFPSYRYYYEHNDGRITFFCSEYESSYSGVSYIIDERALEDG